MLKMCSFFIILFFCSCVKQPQLLSESSTNSTEGSGFYSFIFDFKSIDTLGAFQITLANATLHSGVPLKKSNNHIELEEARLQAYFKTKNQLVDSVFFENPLLYRFEVYKDEKFETGVIQKDASSIMLRVNQTAIDEIQIVKEDSVLFLFKVP